MKQDSNEFTKAKGSRLGLLNSMYRGEKTSEVGGSQASCEIRRGLESDGKGKKNGGVKRLSMRQQE